MKNPLCAIPAILACLGSAAAIEVRGYTPVAHDRFLGFPSNPTVNPGQDFSHLDLSGIGWFEKFRDIQFALISRQHVLFASHFAGVVDPVDEIRFLSGQGTQVVRLVPTEVVVDRAGVATDLILFTLDSPIDESEGVLPLPILDSNDPLILPGVDLGVCGRNPSGTTSRFPVIGKAKLVEVLTEDLELDVGGDEIIDFTTKALQFDYLFDSGLSGECHYVGGDSGSPIFVEKNGVATLFGIHSAINPILEEEFEEGVDPEQIGWQNFDSFVPEYAAELNAMMAPMGYRVRPVDAPSTSLAGVNSVVQTSPRRSRPLDLEFQLSNDGANLTGNLEVEFHFDAGAEPDSVSAPGWVTYGAGAKWTLRKATMSPAESATLVASWSVAPGAESLEPTIVWRSDTVAEESIQPVIMLAPSFDDWAADLTEGGQNDDPDRDLLVNLLEYALGGDPESGVMVFTDGGPLQPVLERDGNQFSFSFPERSDKVIRGLSYALEFSSDLSAWSSVPPGGMVSSTEPYAPAVEGFVKSIHTWAATPSNRFVRLRVLLNE